MRNQVKIQLKRMEMVMKMERRQRREMKETMVNHQKLQKEEKKVNRVKKRKLMRHHSNGHKELRYPTILSITTKPPVPGL